MARAYNKTSLNSSIHELAVMLDCVVRKCRISERRVELAPTIQSAVALDVVKYGYPIEEFYQKFLASDVSR